MTVRVHPSACAELKKAHVWYEERSPLSAAAFAQQGDRAISRIEEVPMRYAAAEHGTRRLILPQFPFNIFYRVGTIEIVVVAIAHQKRKPGYWTKRVEIG
jgi:plasmid stabilization system protein ParE